MKIISFLFITLATLSFFCLAKSHKDKIPCALSSQYVCEMNRYKLSSDYKVENYMIGQLYVDYDDKQMRFDRRSKLDKCLEYSIWVDFNNENGFAFDRNNHECYTFNNEMKLHDNKFPKDSKLIGTRIIGSQAVDTWKIKTKEKDDVFMLVEVTPDNCFPTSFKLINTTEHKPVILAEIWNYLPKLPPFAFDLPTECEKLKTGLAKSKPIPKNILEEIKTFN